MQGLTLKVMGDVAGESIEIALSPGDEGTAETIAVMRAMAHDFATRPAVRMIAASVRQQARERGRGSISLAHELAALFAWFKRRILFCRDPRGYELIRRPDHLVSNMRGGNQACADCDDASVLGASILLALGHTPVYVTISRDRGDYEHVYWGVKTPGGYIAMDPQEFDRVGQEADGIVRHKVWEV